VATRSFFRSLSACSRWRLIASYAVSGWWRKIAVKISPCSPQPKVASFRLPIVRRPCIEPISDELRDDANRLERDVVTRIALCPHLAAIYHTVIELALPGEETQRSSPVIETRLITRD
jgi:hypothetical protein